jgi:membrane-associated phospholipid phosphatase
MNPPVSPNPNRRLAASRRRCLREAGLVWHGGWCRLRSRLWLILLAIGIGLTLIGLGGDADKDLLEQVRLDPSAATTQTAKCISGYSDLFLCVPLSLALWIIGVLRRRARWRRLGLACLMAALMAGLIVTVCKHVVGRPRPDAARAFPQRLYGPGTRTKLHSFPSGHTATSTATGISLIAAAPLLAIPGTIYAASVGWSRMQLRKHYPMDVATGAIIGLLCGACFASTVPGSVIRLSRRKRPPEKDDG